jgi:hypothetical protein
MSDFVQLMTHKIMEFCTVMLCTLVPIYQTTWPHIPEYCIINIHCQTNLKCYLSFAQLKNKNKN